MKVIFLDIDGVLNCAGSSSRAPSGYIGVDDSKVKRLKKIVDATNAVIVLVSTWKDGWSHALDRCTEDGAYLTRKLARRGLRILAKTTDQIFDRGRGIHQWLTPRIDRIESWIVLDDDIFNDYEQYGILPHLIKTDFSAGGLTDELAEQAIALLNV